MVPSKSAAVVGHVLFSGAALFVAVGSIFANLDTSYHRRARRCAKRWLQYHFAVRSVRMNYYRTISDRRVEEDSAPDASSF